MLRSHAVPGGVLYAALSAIAFAAAPVQHAPVDAGLLLLVYALLALALTAATACAWALARGLGVLFAVATGAVVAWHVREQFTVAQSLPELLAVTLGFALAWLACFRLGARRAPPGHAALLAGGAAVALLVTLASAYHGSNTFRWHLLRHHKLLGTPVYYALAEPVVDVRDALWSSRADGDETAPGPANGARPDTRRPHLVFLLIDTLRADALAALGGDPSHMPHVNRLAERSLVMSDVKANSSWTRPSMASMFTGLLQEEHGAVDRWDRLPARRETIAEVLRDAGYRTAAFVSNYGAVGRDAGFDQGFDHFDEVRGARAVYARGDEMNAAVEPWLEANDDGTQPLFLYVHYLDPHTPYLSGGSQSARHDLARDAYVAELRYVDGQIRALLDLLERRLDGPVYLVLTSDHGEEFGEHGERGHGKSLYREVLWIPALLHGPGVASGVDATPLEGRDFFHLLRGLALADGDTLARWPHERARDVRRASIYSTTPSAVHRPYLEVVCMRSVEQEGHQLIWSGYGDTFELYDGASDPNESDNRLRDEPQRAALLQSVLEGGPRTWASRESVDSDDATIDQLRALGYLQ